MKPKKNLITARATVVVKHPFVGTTIHHIDFGSLSPEKITHELVVMQGELDHFDYESDDAWTKWILNRKSEGWGKRKIFNFVREYFEYDDSMNWIPVLIDKAFAAESPAQKTLAPGKEKW